MTDLDNKVIEAIVKTLKEEFKNKKYEETIEIFNKIRQHVSFLYLEEISNRLNEEESTND